ncbi:MAG: hypothetical protein ACKVOH_01285 [Chlamydiales bacterium]
MTSLTASLPHSLFPSTDWHDDFNHRLFLVSHERGLDETLQIMAGHPLVGRVHIFVGGMFGLDVASVRGVEGVLALDRGIRTQRFWEFMIREMPLVESKEDAVLKINTFVFENREMFFGGGSGAGRDPEMTAKIQLLALHRMRTQGISWLSTDERFMRIQSMFKAGNIEFRRFDLNDTKKLQWTQLFLMRNGWGIDSVNVSNTHEESYGAVDAMALPFIARAGILLIFSTREEGVDRGGPQCRQQVRVV